MELPDSLTRVADERVLDLEIDGVKMVFAFGPPEPSGTKEERMGRILSALGSEISAIRWAQQIHGRLVASLAAEPGCPLEDASCVGRCDALISANPGIGLVVWSADCVPILIAGGGVVAAVHSGWRGSVADVGGAVVRRFSIEYGVPPHSLRAVLGPAISGPRYEVSQEVIDGLQTLDPAKERWLKGNQVDLRGFLRLRLENLGLDPENIRTVGPCTASTPELASYRRDGSQAGRQWSMVYRARSSD